MLIQNKRCENNKKSTNICYFQKRGNIYYQCLHFKGAAISGISGEVEEIKCNYSKSINFILEEKKNEKIQ